MLAASDAVGMGLNLNIRRVIFYSLSKYDGDRVVRRGSRYPDGLVTMFNAGDLDYLLECLRRPFEEVKQAGLCPFFEQFELFAARSLISPSLSCWISSAIAADWMELISSLAMIMSAWWLLKLLLLLSFLLG